MQPIIELTNITKRFGSFLALDDVSLNVQPGVTGLLGPNGAGKSTLIKILLGLLKASEGSGEVLGFDIRSQARSIRSDVGYMPEDDCFFFGLTGIESVQVSARLSGLPPTEGLRRAHEILDFCGLQQERYRKAETYSTGMRQKLRFAQAVVHDPSLLILDEPTSGLDPEEREIMLRRIQRLATDHGKTILICTHILPDVQAVSESVIILAQGKVQVADRLENLNRPSSPSLNLRIVGNVTEFLDELAAKGITVARDDKGWMTVQGEQGDLTECVWDAARSTGATIRSLAPSRNSLEEIFLSAVQAGSQEQSIGST